MPGRVARWPGATVSASGSAGRCQRRVSSAGVALPATGMFRVWAPGGQVAGVVAETVLLLQGTVMGLVDRSGRFASGVKMAERVPMMMRALPSRAASQLSSRSRSVRPSATW